MQEAELPETAQNSSEACPSLSEPSTALTAPASRPLQAGEPAAEGFSQAEQAIMQEIPSQKVAMQQVIPQHTAAPTLSHAFPAAGGPGRAHVYWLDALSCLCGSKSCRCLFQADRVQQLHRGRPGGLPGGSQHDSCQDVMLSTAPGTAAMSR